MDIFFHFNFLKFRDISTSFFLFFICFFIFKSVYKCFFSKPEIYISDNRNFSNGCY